MARREGLIRARKAAGLTQAEVAGLLGIPRSLYCDIELGKRPLRVERAKQLADLLDLRLEDLVLSTAKGRETRQHASELRAARDEQTATSA